MADFRAIIDNLVSIHFYDVILPFLLVYVVVFAILEKSGIFHGGANSSNDNLKSVHAVIALVFALFTIASIQTVMWIQNFIVYIVLFLVFILCVLIMLAFVFGEDFTNFFKESNGKWKPWLVWGVFAIVIITALITFLYVTGTVESALEIWDDWDADSELISTVLVLIGIVAVIVWVSKGNGNSGGSNNKPE